MLRADTLADADVTISSMLPSGRGDGREDSPSAINPCESDSLARPGHPARHLDTAVGERPVFVSTPKHRVDLLDDPNVRTMIEKGFAPGESLDVGIIGS